MYKPTHNSDREFMSQFSKERRLFWKKMPDTNLTFRQQNLSSSLRIDLSALSSADGTL